MTRKRLIVTAVLSAVLFLVPYWCFATVGFALRVVDETGRGVANVRLVDAAGNEHVSNAVGMIWLKRSDVGPTVLLSRDGSPSETRVPAVVGTARDGEPTVVVFTGR